VTLPDAAPRLASGVVCGDAVLARGARGDYSPGRNCTRVAALSIAEEGRVAPAELHLDIANHRPHLPAGATLQPNTHYRLRLSLAGRVQPADLSFVASSEGSLVVLRIE
jgi:hypothetical protein